MVFGMRAGFLSSGWFLVAAAAVSIYVWSPLWPHSLARFPLWPYLPIFSVTIVLVALYLRRRLSAGSILFGVVLIAMYFYLEDLVPALSLYASRGNHLPLAPYFLVPTFNVLANLPVMVTFAALETAIAVLGRLNGPATVAQ
jgi:hypothetical protein